MGQRFDLKDTPIAARQNLHIIKQTEDESIEAFLQRVMTVATDGYGMAVRPQMAMAWPRATHCSRWLLKHS